MITVTVMLNANIFPSHLSLYASIVAGHGQQAQPSWNCGGSPALSPSLPPSLRKTDHPYWWGKKLDPHKGDQKSSPLSLCPAHRTVELPFAEEGSKSRDPELEES